MNTCTPEQIKEMVRLLEVSLMAFNEIPNKSLGISDFKNTYDLATKIRKLLKEVK